MQNDKKTYLVTGGTGSLGQQIVRRLLEKDIKKVIVYSRGEHKQVEMARSVNDKRVRFIVGDVANSKSLNRATSGVNIIIHAAALKHISTCEYNPDAALETNVIGAINVRDAAILNRVQKVVAISTDKAVIPINLYGNTKALSDGIFTTADAYAAGKTLFAVVRFGNFIGSRGSVLPLWKRQLENGEPLTVTDDTMTRFFISPDEAVSRIFDSLKLMRGGEIFCPKAPSAKMYDLARALGGGIEIIGKRDGEKIHEDLIIAEDAHRTFEIEKFYIITKTYRGLGNKVPANFSYRSDTNWDWINPEVIK